MKVTAKQGKLRLVDGSETPIYLEIDFDEGNFSGPMGTPKVEEILVLDRGKVTADFHYIEGSDEKLMGTVQISFSAFIVDKTQCGYLLDWLDECSNGDSASPPQATNAINSNTLISTKQDTQRDGSNNNPAFKDGTKLCSNVELKFDMSTDIVYHYNEVWFPLDEQSISEGEDGTRISLTGYVYGTITRDDANTGDTNIED